MSGKSKSLTLTIASAIIFASASLGNAQCNNSAGCNNAQCGECNVFTGNHCHNVANWPNANSQCGCGAGACLAEAMRKCKDEFDLVTARNMAWPLPFNCQDRASYYAVWQTQFAHGLQVAHSLTHEYFDPVTDELNRAGRAKVAWIMQTSPVASRHIYIYEDTNDERRLAKRQTSIQNIVDQWYGHMGGVNIARSQVFPNRIPAHYQERISQQYRDGQPVPVIPVDTGGSITSSVGG